MSERSWSMKLGSKSELFRVPTSCEVGLQVGLQVGDQVGPEKGYLKHPRFDIQLRAQLHAPTSPTHFGPPVVLPGSKCWDQVGLEIGHEVGLEIVYLKHPNVAQSPTSPRPPKPFNGVSDILFRAQLQAQFRAQLGPNFGHKISPFAPGKHEGWAKMSGGSWSMKLGSKLDVKSWSGARFDIQLRNLDYFVFQLRAKLGSKLGLKLGPKKDI
ncbi:hypothetical protein B0H11DRAFT_2210282 [Mycena galericulata]|nr:hypothetical protein B0H11DRAFT_2210282 [Mycena galericulata]